MYSVCMYSFAMETVVHSLCRFSLCTKMGTVVCCQAVCKHCIIASSPAEGEERVCRHHTAYTDGEMLVDTKNIMCGLAAWDLLG